MPTLKLFEQFGEATLQFVIAVTFYSTNWLWLDAWEQFMGVATMTLSWEVLVNRIWNKTCSPGTNHMNSHRISSL